MIKFNRILTLEEMINVYLKICPYCKRKAPNGKWFTKNIKCIWCDDQYHQGKK